MDILIDTNLLLIYSRDSRISERIEEDHGVFNKKNRLFISVVTLGELDALTKKLGIGKRRRKKIEDSLKNVAIIRLNQREIIDRYGDIDAYSQGKLHDRKGRFTSRNMGKNDMWIAATASVFNLKLFTTDKDFEHLDGAFVDLAFIDIEQYKV